MVNEEAIIHALLGDKIWQVLSTETSFAPLPVLKTAPKVGQHAAVSFPYYKRRGRDNAERLRQSPFKKNKIKNLLPSQKAGFLNFKQHMAAAALAAGSVSAQGLLHLGKDVPLENRVIPQIMIKAAPEYSKQFFSGLPSSRQQQAATGNSTVKPPVPSPFPSSSESGRMRSVAEASSSAGQGLTLEEAESWLSSLLNEALHFL
jgi:hypothetical protein